ncbi:MAG: hypothetical protein K9N47_27865 [Prosthecobacter sp.]|nr:hypothetical protein [Prosthecobacter sp.]
MTFRSCLGLLFGLLAAFFPHAARATAPGQVVAWGSNNAGQISVPVSATDGVIAIAAGDSFSAALKDNGTVVTWGDSYNPAEIAVPSGVNNITAIAAGVEHIVALRSDGKVAAWGYNIGGEVTGMPGGGITSANPVTLGGQVLSNVVGVACGTVHSIAVKNDGTVVVWGSNYFGQLNVPAGLTDVVAAAGGMYHSLALKSDGTVVAWGGQNTYGEINVPAGLTDVVQVSAGEYYSMALKSDGTVVAWGDNSQGQLNVPAGLNDAVQIAAARYHALALKSDATIVPGAATLTVRPPFPRPHRAVCWPSVVACIIRWRWSQFRPPFSSRPPTRRASPARLRPSPSPPLALHPTAINGTRTAFSLPMVSESPAPLPPRSRCPASL